MRTAFAQVLVVACVKCPAQSAHARLRAELETIHELDQRDRANIGAYPLNTPERDSVVDHMIRQDSLNTARITAIIDSAGWLGPEDVGRAASSALWLVLQHADLPVQERYLPEMRLAVAEGKAQASELAYVEDRIEVRNNRPQIYGSQVLMKDGRAAFAPIRDEEHVNERRASVGLGPLEDYAGQFGIPWSPPKKQERVLLFGPAKP